MRNLQRHYVKTGHICFVLYTFKLTTHIFSSVNSEVTVKSSLSVDGKIIKYIFRKTTVTWFVVSCNAKAHRDFGWTYRLHLQGRRLNQEKVAEEGGTLIFTSETSVFLSTRLRYEPEYPTPLSHSRKNAISNIDLKEVTCDDVRFIWPNIVNGGGLLWIR
jgi:hypothetical protein